MGRSIASTAPVRKCDVTRKSFGKAASKLSYLFNYSAHDYSKAEKIRLWNEFIPLAPAVAAKILRRGLPRDTEVVLKMDDMGEGDILFHADGKFNDDGSFDLSEKTLDAGIIRVQDGHKGKGYGRMLFRNQVEFFYACGVRTFEISAGLENGGYTWARVGFLPYDVKDDDFKRNVIELAEETMEVLAPLLTEKEKKHLEKYLKFRKREDLWHIADAKSNMGPKLQDIFNKAANKESPRAQKIVASLSSHFSRETMDYLRNCVQSGKEVSLGRLLLTGTSWEGCIDMDNVKQMQRFADYTGGFRYLQIK